MKTKLHEDTRHWLREFNEQANYSSRNTNPHDYSRWVRFVIAAYINGDDLAEQEVRELLVEAGWDGESATRLSVEFRACLRFIPTYEKYSPDHLD